MRRFHLYFCLLLLTGCQLEEIWDNVTDESKESFTIEEAREFFEDDYSQKITKATRENGRGKFATGDFTPLWDKTEIIINGRYAAYYINIIAENKIFAIRANFGAKGAKAERIEVPQWLVVMKNTMSGKMTSCILSIIHETGHGGKGKTGFSGIAVFSSVTNGAIIRVLKFKDGKKIDGVHIPYGNGTYVDRCRKAKELIGLTGLISKKNIMTKSGEDDWGYDSSDDDYDDDYDSWNTSNFEDLGEGVYTDGEGNYYLDIDEDGIIDTETIAPGMIEEDSKEESPWPEEDEETEPEDIPEENENDWIEDDYNDDYNDDVWEEDSNDTDNGDEGGLEEQTIKEKAKKLDDVLGNSIDGIKKGLTTSVVTTNEFIAEITPIRINDIWEKTSDYVIVIKSGLTDLQMELVLVHEFMHLKLFEISQDAGSAAELAKSNLELLTALNRYNINDGHHFYMGEHIEETETLLRQAFPGRDEEFYEYGKWGGGAFNSEAFEKLPLDEQQEIYNYLSNLQLYKK